VRASGGLVSGDDSWKRISMTTSRKKSEPTWCWNQHATPRIRVNTLDGVCSRWWRG